VLELIVKFVFETPLKLTAVMPLKLVPVITTLVPVAPLLGLNPVILGNVLKVLLNRVKRLLVAVPPGVTTVIGPEVPVLGTVAVILVAELMVKLGEVTPLNLTAVAPVKLAP
jgi:hypothetical protein